jgi:hypothetical protein
MRGGLLNRRDFLIKAFQVGGLAALVSLGVSPKEARAVAGHHLGFMQPEAPAGCDTVFFENTSAHAGNLVVASVDGESYSGQDLFRPAADGYLCKITWILTKDGGNSIETTDWYCQVWTKDGTSLGAKQAASDPVRGVDSWSSTSVTFEFSTPVLLPSGEDRAIVLCRSDESSGGAIYIRYSYSTSGGGLTGQYARWNSDKTRAGTSSADARITGYK